MFPSFNVSLWILQGLLAIILLATGLLKTFASEDKLRSNQGLHWTRHETLQRVRIAGVAELLAALGMILPGVTKIAPFLTPLAALGIVVLMVLAVVTVHRPHKEAIGGNLGIAFLALLVLLGRIAEPVA